MNMPHRANFRNPERIQYLFPTGNFQAKTTTHTRTRLVYTCLELLPADINREISSPKQGNVTG